MPFEPNYRWQELVEKKDWEYRKIYSESLYLAMPGFRKEVPFRSVEPLSVCIRIKGEIFGDPMGFPLTESDLIRIFIVNSEDKLENVLTMDIINKDLGEVRCLLNEFTFRRKGTYEFYIKLNDIILKSDYQIIVK